MEDERKIFSTQTNEKYFNPVRRCYSESEINEGVESSFSELLYTRWILASNRATPEQSLSSPKHTRFCRKVRPKGKCLHPLHF
jgi:hypothetical protein